MMKLISLLFLTLFVGKGCTAQNLTDKTTAVRIEYNAVSRGLYQNVRIENKKATVSKSRNEPALTTEISDADWKILMNAFQKIKLDSLSKWKAPTQKRFHDGAAIANLKIDCNGKTYQSASFDHGFPPAALKKLVTILVSYTEK